MQTLVSVLTLSLTNYVILKKSHILLNPPFLFFKFVKWGQSISRKIYLRELGEIMHTKGELSAWHRTALSLSFLKSEVGM